MSISQRKSKKKRQGSTIAKNRNRVKVDRKELGNSGVRSLGGEHDTTAAGKCESPDKDVKTISRSVQETLGIN